VSGEGAGSGSPAPPGSSPGPRRLLPRFSLRSWLLLSYLTVLALPVVAVVVSGALAGDLRQQTRVEITAQAHVWALTIGHELKAGGSTLDQLGPSLSDRLAEARDRTLSGVQVIDAAGVVVASTGARVGHSLGDDPEVQRALAGEVATQQRPRARVSRRQTDLRGPSRFASVRIFVAVPIEEEGEVLGAVVVSRTPREELQALAQMAPRLVGGVAFTLACTLVLAGASVYWSSRSLRRLSRAALDIARGATDAPQLATERASHVREVAALAGAVDTMRAQLQARLHYIDEFAGNVAHEFRTPIATLRGTFELMHDDPQMPPEQRERFVSNALAELLRLDALVGGLLALARAEQPTGPARVDLHELLVDCCEGRPQVTVEGRAGVVRGSAEQLEAVVLNLVDNALQHGDPAGSVTVRAWSREGETGFEVVDEGQGIEPGDLERVFDRFFTTDRRRGIGLGLAMVRLVCRAHGGEVTVRSRPGHTVFSVALPAAERGSAP